MLVLTGKLGEIAALATALCWVFTSLAFAAAGRRVGPTAVNLLRLLLAVMILAAVHRLAFGSWWPAVDRAGLWYLAASGVVGLAIGDQCLFTALVDVGPRIATLLMTLAPPVTAIIAWPLLDEPLGPASIAGIAVTVGGIAWVVAERSAGAAPRPARHRRRGILLGGLAGVCQAVGIVLAKIGMGHGRLDEALHIEPWPATLVRMSFAAAVLGLVVAGLRRRSGARQRRGSGDELDPAGNEPARWPGMLSLIGLVVLGPVLGVWLSLVAVDRAPAGVAATLIAMSPVFILPFAAWIEGERITIRAGLGALVAVAGVAILTVLS